MYKFNSKLVDGQSLIHVINLCLGENLIGAEVGVFKGQTLCTILQNCPKIKLLYAIDNYKPYSDFLGSQNGNACYSIDEKEIDYIRMTAHHNVKWSGFTDKVLFLQYDSHYVSKNTQDESLDFVFLDTCMTYEQQVQDLNDWYSKVKNGGLFVGHDWNASEVQNAVLQFRKQHNISKPLSTFDNTWMWLK